MDFTSIMFVAFFWFMWFCAEVSSGKLENTKFVDVTEEPRNIISKDTMTRIIPMLATPFMMQTMFMPIAMMFMKFVLLNSIFIGKLGIILWIVNIIRNHAEPGGEFYSHNVNLPHNEHPGHQFYPKNEGIHHWEKGVSEYSYRRRKRS
ncbi:uncharacterized protein [Leptinotarsa decemlineata]|uniref:uncharacterized protein n=1 Tax=Leptinotarsa decemlineata TaxID=7539 RepID=UPI003D305A6B